MKPVKPKYVAQPAQSQTCNREMLLSKTMDLALERYHLELEKIREEKQMQHEDFNWRIRAEQQLIEAEKRHKKEQQAINYAEIAL